MVLLLRWGELWRRVLVNVAHVNDSGEFLGIVDIREAFGRRRFVVVGVVDEDMDLRRARRSWGDGGCIFGGFFLLVGWRTFSATWPEGLSKKLIGNLVFV